MPSSLRFLFVAGNVRPSVGRLAAAKNRLERIVFFAFGTGLAGWLAGWLPLEEERTADRRRLHNYRCNNARASTYRHSTSHGTPPNGLLINSIIIIITSSRQQSWLNSFSDHSFISSSLSPHTRLSLSFSFSLNLPSCCCTNRPNHMHRVAPLFSFTACNY